MKFLLLLSLCLLTLAPVAAQDNLSWRKHRKLARTALENKNFSLAADQFGKAFARKPKCLDLAYAAGENYLRSNNYESAVALLEPLKSEYKKFPLAQLWLARALKKTGRYEQAFKEFAGFTNNYSGEDKDKLVRQVQNEMKGCELGAQLNAPERRDSALVELLPLDAAINTTFTDFAPIPFGEGVLYFSSTRNGKARIYRSQLSNGAWSAVETPKGFPDLGEKHYANGSFADEGQLFYFTQCQSVATADGVGTECAIFVMARNGNAWKTPQPLRDYINLPGTTNSQPSVVQVGDEELLFFASNRSGGQGGMDIWYCVRKKGSADLDFTLPQNCGPYVNTPNDEITPFYDALENKLYFSSDGQIGIGGLDVFVSEAIGDNFGKPKNLGLPINSPADDYYYVLSNGGLHGFLTSNRPSGLKINSTNDDIFSFSAKVPQLLVDGKIYPGPGQPLLAGVQVSLYEMTNANGQKRLLESINSADGNYQFPLLPGKHYRLEAAKEGFYTSTYEFDGDISKPKQFIPLYVEARSSGNAPSKPGPKPAPVIPSSGGNTPAPNVPSTARNMKPADGSEVLKTNAPVGNGGYYKVQLQAVKDLKAPSARMAQAEAIARVDYELIPSKGLYRMLLGDYASMDSAQKAQQNAVAAGFSGAFIVRYENGIRQKK